MSERQQLQHYSRREFVKNTVAAAAVASLGADAGLAAVAERDEADRATKSERPRIGCVSWCFHRFDSGTDPTEAIEQIGSMGFDGIELILLDRKDIKNFWTTARIADVNKRLEKYRLRVPQFVIFQPVVQGLTSTNADERKRNLDYFEEGCRIGRQLGSPMVNIVAPWPRELTSPPGANTYLPRYCDLPHGKPGEKFHINMAAGFNWEELWPNFIETIKACLDRAKRHGMALSIEHHTHTMVHDATAFLRLWDSIRDPALGYNLDAGWTLLQREYPPVAIHKVKRRLVNAHLRDIDGSLLKFVHIGQGVMDFQAIAATLQSVGFTGFATLEQDKHPGDMAATCRRYLAMMRQYFA